MGRETYHIPERFLRQLWKHQQFSTRNLRTTDGKSIEIISPGKFNQDGGPDFTGAVIRINGLTYRGEVEIHQRNDEWFQHRHHEDAKYNSVVLHVVLHKEISSTLPTTLSKRTVPVLALDQYLISEYKSIWERMILDERAERLVTIKCFQKNGNIEPTDIKKWLEKLAVERIELKVRRFEERLKEIIDEQRLHIKEPPPRYGDIPFGINPEDLPQPIFKYSKTDFRKIEVWERLLYEGVMEALGYSKNQEPFLKLARNLSPNFFSDSIDLSLTKDQILHIEAILFGAAGFLIVPGKEMDNESKKYLNSLRSIWKEYRKLYRKEFLKESDWQFFRLRPENFPTVRLAGASRFVVKFLQNRILKLIVQITKSTGQDSKDKYSELEQIFTIPADGYWITHFRFGETSKITLKTLIGKSRADEIILNAVIPICLLYARIFKDKDFRTETLKIFDHCPPLSDNTITKIISSQLIRSKFKLSSAKLQQGALQCYKFYCAEEKCGECSVGKLAF
ncbi:MAG: DUF2851 family protein [Bacteroidota bacterium]|nr:DUF2851 family protein [Bacteroidota bacterium]